MTHLTKTLITATCAIFLLRATLTHAVAPPQQALAAQQFDMQSVPLSNTPLPAFPYLDWPSNLEIGYRNVVIDKSFDQTFVIVGRALRAVEGHVTQHNFPNDPVGWSAIAAQRNYANIIKNLGGVKVNSALPGDPTWLRQQGGEPEAVFKKLRLTDNGDNVESRGVVSYDVYLIRHTNSNVWFAVAEVAGGSSTSLLVIEEKALEQNVATLSAPEMAASLQKDGHVALYLSFDTDRDVIKLDSTAVIDEMAKLLRAQPALKVVIEGHTDNVGDSAHNKTLSLARANAVVRALVAQKIDPARLTAVGLGSSKPIAANDTEDGRHKNRRVELVRK